MKRISYDDDDLELEFDLLKKKIRLSNAEAKVSQYLLCKHGSLYWIDIAFEVDLSAYNVKVEFMHPSYLNQSYRCPLPDDDCWVPHTTYSHNNQHSFTICCHWLSISYFT